MKHIGDEGEIAAIRYLQKHEYQILTTNYKFGRFGEIDIVAQKENKTYFFEVKFRNTHQFGLPEESVTPSKLRKMKKTLEHYCMTHRVSFEAIQFDVLAIEKTSQNYQIRHYKNIQIET